MKNPNVLISCDYGSIIVNRYDSFIGAEISKSGYWAKDDIDLIKKLIRFRLKNTSKICFYDVGANIGTHTLAIAKSFQDNVVIRSFEAQRTVFYMLCGTIALNGLNNVKAENVAVSDENNNSIQIELPDYMHFNNFGGLELIAPIHSDNQNMTKSHSELVATRTLDSYDEYVDFLKIDIEGMEDKALRGAVKLIDRSRPICFIEILKTDVEFVTTFFLSRNYIGFKKNNDLLLIPAESNVRLQGLERVF
jgi:FkbM family methyltransferase